MERRNARIFRDLADFYSKEVEQAGTGLKVIQYDDNLTIIEVSFSGPLESPFEGGTFTVKFNLSKNFPLEAPKVFLTTHVWHPNVSPYDGAVCMDLLDSNWSSGTSLIEYTEAVRSLLLNPNPLSPLNIYAADMLESDSSLCEANAALFSTICAGGTSSVRGDLEENLSVLLGLGQRPKDALKVGAKYNCVMRNVIEHFGYQIDVDQHDLNGSP